MIHNGLVELFISNIKCKYMKYVLTARKPIKSKTGSEFALYHAIDEKGETVTLFLTPEQESEYGVSSESVIASVAELFEAGPVANVDFNNRGRVVSVEVEGE